MKKILHCVVFILIFSFCFSLFSCDDKQKASEKEEDTSISEFVYIDQSGCLHVDKRCLELHDWSDEHPNNNYQVHFIETKKLSPNEYKSICSYCVSDDDFKKIKEISKQNDYEKTPIDSIIIGY